MESLNTKEPIWHILLVDDDEDDYLLTRAMLSGAQRGKYEIEWVSTYNDGRKALLECRYDAALVDYDMGAHSGIELIREVVSAGCTTPIILFTGRGTYDVDVEAMQAGAMDYLTKGETNPALLERTIRYAIERRRNETALESANEALSAANAQLAAGRQELAEILGSIRDGFFSLDRDWRFVYVNSIAASHGGTSPNDLIGKQIWESHPHLVGSILWDRFQNVMSTRQPAHFEVSGMLAETDVHEIRVYPSTGGISVYWIDVSEQKAIASTLERERELLQKLFDNIPVLINIYTPGSPVPQVNAYFTRMTGWTGEDLAAGNLMELCYPDQRYRQEVQDFINSHAEGWIDCNVSTSSGEVLQTSWTNMRLSDGTHIGIGIDISERKRAEQAMLDKQRLLAERNQQIESLFENAPAGLAIFEAQPPYRLITCNNLYQQVQVEPFRTSGLVGLGVREFIDRAEEDGLLAIFEEVSQTGIARVMTKTPVEGGPEGRTWWNWSLAPVREGGQITRLAMLVVDVTEEVRARSVLEQERAFLNAVLEQMPSAVMIIEAPDGRLVLANQQVENILRFSLRREEIFSSYQNMQGVFSDGRPVHVDEWPVMRSLRSGEVVRDETITLKRGDGSPGTFAISSAPIHDMAGRIVAAAAIFHDITERKRAEQDTTFLIDLGELLNQESDPNTVLAVVGKRLVTHLDAARCVFYRVDAADRTVSILHDSLGNPSATLAMLDMKSIPESLLEDHQSGRVVVLKDTMRDARTSKIYSQIEQQPGTRAYVAVPLVRDGKRIASMLIGDSRPRKWNDRQIALIQTVAERTWAAFETQRLMAALRENQERFRILAEDAQRNLEKLETIIANLHEGVLISNLDGEFTRINPAALELYGFETQEEMMRGLDHIFALVEAWTPDGQPIPDAERPIARAARGETVLQFEMHARRIDTGKQWIGLYSSIPVTNQQGETLFIISTIIDITQIRTSEAQRSEMRAMLQTQHLLVAQREEERLQIARDIHDGPIQDLILLTYNIQEMLQRTTSDATHQDLNDLRQRIQKLVEDLRGVCNELRPPMLTRFGLAKAIQSHAEELQEREPGRTIILDLDEETNTLPSDVRLALYRIYQESMNNILRHADATRARVRLRIEPEAITLEVHDNGTGFNLPHDWLTLAREGHLGLVGIKERAEAIGGQLVLTSKPGLGTRVCVRLPRTKA